MMNQYGATTVSEAAAEIIDYTERRMRAAIMAVPDGCHHGSGESDGPVTGSGRLRCEVGVTVAGDEIVVDFSGSDPQVAGNHNMPFATACSATYVALLTLVGSSLPHNEGCFRPIDIVAPAGTWINPSPPAAVAWGFGLALIEAIWDAMKDALPEHVPAGLAAPNRPIISGVDPRSGEAYGSVLLMAQSGGGAVHGNDGTLRLNSAVSMGGLRYPGVELEEVRMPIMTLACTYLTDSGGAGRWRGAPGMAYYVQPVDHEATFIRVGDDYLHQPRGRLGGLAGWPNRAFIGSSQQELRELEWTEVTGVLPAGSVLGIHEGGGGGLGSPLAREIDAVVTDVLDGWVSLAAAKETYGVVLDPHSMTVDVDATAAEREKLKTRYGEN
jgi:N-methylhydantoinase B